jgi:hypothetical protein
VRLSADLAAHLKLDAGGQGVHVGRSDLKATVKILACLWAPEKQLPIRLSAFALSPTGSFDPRASITFTGARSPALIMINGAAKNSGR